MGDEFKRVMILADYGSADLAQRVYNELAKRDIHDGLEVFSKDDLYINRFAAGEIDVDIKRNVRGRDVFLIKSYNVFSERWEPEKRGPPGIGELVMQPNEGYMELWEINDSLKRGEARSVTDVLPFMAYQRQDRRPKRNGKKTRSPVSAKLYARMTEMSGADRIINLDPHFKTIEGFYNIPFEGLDSFVIFAEYIENNLSSEMGHVVFASPDHGSAERTKDYANYFKRPFVIIDKKREKPGVSSAEGIIGELSVLQGAICLMPDDIIDGGDTIVKGGEILKANGAKEVRALITHPILSGTALDKLNNAGIKLITTESILIKDKAKYPDITVLDISYPISQAIWYICNGKSISQHLFDYDRYKATRAAKP